MTTVLQAGPNVQHSCTTTKVQWRARLLASNTGDDTAADGGQDGEAQGMALRIQVAMAVAAAAAGSAPDMLIFCTAHIKRAYDELGMHK